MPRIKGPSPDRRTAIIQYCKCYKGWGNEDVQRELKISRDARIARDKNPGLYSLDELTALTHGVPLTPGMLSTLHGGINWDSSGVYIERYAE